MYLHSIVTIQDQPHRAGLHLYTTQLERARGTEF
jgi:hypothetical protein